MEKHTLVDANALHDEQSNEEFYNFRLINNILSFEKDIRIECNRVLLES